jgi:hypothetical protein
MTTNWVGWMMSIIVLILIFALGAILKNSVSLLITGKRAVGTVVGIDSTMRFSSNGEGPMVSPLVEFATAKGELIKVTGQHYSSSTSVHVGDIVSLVYSRSNPKNIQFLKVREFPIMPVGVVLGFVLFILLVWIGVILVSEDRTLGDPLHLLTNVIDRFKINPVRFPFYLIMSLVIPGCLISTYVLTKDLMNLLSNGIKVEGVVTGIKYSSSRLNNGDKASGIFPMIDYKDASGTLHTIRRSLAKPLSRLIAGDKVEVIYPPARPGEGVVNTWDELYPPPLFFGLFLLAMLTLLRLVLIGTIKLK